MMLCNIRANVFVIFIINFAFADPQRNHRKATLFLQRNAVPGIGGIFTPEDAISQVIIRPMGPPDVPEEIQKRILGGNYPENMDVPAIDEYQNMLMNPDAGANGTVEETVNQEGAAEMVAENYGEPVPQNNPLIDPIKQLILDAVQDTPIITTTTRKPSGGVVRGETNVTDPVEAGAPDVAPGEGTGAVTPTPSEGVTPLPDSTGSETEPSTNKTGGHVQLVVDITLLSEGGAAFVTQQVKCSEKVVPKCLSMGIPQAIFTCSRYCLLGPHPVGRATSRSVASALKSLCNPIGTIFDSGVPLFHKNAKDILTTEHFLMLFQAAPEFHKRFARYGINAVPMLLIKYTGSVEAQLLKKTMNALEGAVKSEANGLNPAQGLMINTACSIYSSVDPLYSIIFAFYNNYKLFDLILTGSWTVSRIFPLVADVDLSLRFMMQALAGGLNIAGGLNLGCGMLYESETGMEPECQPEETINWSGGSQQVLPAEGGNQIVCGSMPYIPPRLNDDVFPSIFLQEAPTTTTEASTTEAEAKTEAGGGSGNGTEAQGLGGRSQSAPLNFGLIDKILNADLEYDDE